jgi:hypothetical protein
MKKSYEEIKEILVKAYRHDRLYGRGDDYGDYVVSKRYQDYLDGKNDDEILISRHDSHTRETIYFDILNK